MGSNAQSAKGNPASKRMQNQKLKSKRIANKARNERDRAAGTRLKTLREAPDPTAHADIVVVLQAYERMRVIQEETANIASQLLFCQRIQHKLDKENYVLATEYKELRKLLNQMREKYGDVVPPAR